MSNLKSILKNSSHPTFETEEPKRHITFSDELECYTISGESSNAGQSQVNCQDLLENEFRTNNKENHSKSNFTDNCAFSHQGFTLNTEEKKSLKEKSADHEKYTTTNSVSNTKQVIAEKDQTIVDISRKEEVNTPTFQDVVNNISSEFLEITDSTSAETDFNICTDNGIYEETCFSESILNNHSSAMFLNTKAAEKRTLNDQNCNITTQSENSNDVVFTEEILKDSPPWKKITFKGINAIRVSDMSEFVCVKDMPVEMKHNLDWMFD